MARKDRLTALQVQKAKPKKRDYKLADGGGLYLLVKANGTKSWRLKYRYLGKEKTLAIGLYNPAHSSLVNGEEVGSHISLDRARTERNRAKNLLHDHKDPSIEKRKEKLLAKVKAETTFESVAREWHKLKSHKWSEGHKHDVIKSLEDNIFPSIGKLPIAEITSDLLRPVLESVQSRGALEATKRLRQRCGSIFRYGKAMGVCSDDPSESLKEVLITPTKKNMAAIQPEELPAFLAALGKYNSHSQTRLAVNLMMLTFVRTTELIGARWEEIDFDNRIWNIPAERMKRKRPHYIPLSKQALEAFKELHGMTGVREHVFPNRNQPRKPMSNGTILRVIDRIGYRNRMTGHGFRSLASTVLNESGKFRPDAIERQLSHEESDDVRAAYNRAEYIQERTEMMQWWADYLDRAAKITSIEEARKLRAYSG